MRFILDIFVILLLTREFHRQFDGLTLACNTLLMTYYYLPRIHYSSNNPQRDVALTAKMLVLVCNGFAGNYIGLSLSNLGASLFKAKDRKQPNEHTSNKIHPIYQLPVK